nr:soluble scavenger receptor cysteine-rich domain-containing protein SSC5D-like [Pocillopora verrucosa]
MTPDVSSLPLPTSTNGSQQHNNSSSTRPIMTPAVSSMSLPSTGFNAASPSMATVVTNASSRQPTVTPAASSLSLPTNGRELHIIMISQQIMKN